MVAMSLGQAVGPLFFGLPSDGWLLPAIPVIGSALLIVATLVLLHVVHVRKSARKPTKVPLREIAATPGLLWIVLTGSICVASLDLLLAFLPVLGEERGIAPATIGLLLSIRAAASLIPRLVFGQAVRRFGRMPLMLASSGMGGAGQLLIALPLPVREMALALVLIGTGLGIALTSSVGLTIDIAPARARGTALSMRLTAHRLAQFFLPLAAGLIAAPLGVAGIFGVTGATLLTALFARPRAL
ncbi:MFS transporter [Devosia sp. XGJD_8]|uniref:MFS transporter n=1 Tax=Devosia sp. XGJD_8 TaxID=3391187 RepID=UPI0039848E1E